MKNADQPIVPTIWRQASETSFKIASDRDIKDGIYLSSTNGLTKREYFAGLAMQGLLSRTTYKTKISVGSSDGSDSIDPKGICNDAIIYADELLKQLEE